MIVNIDADLGEAFALVPSDSQPSTAYRVVYNGDEFTCSCLAFKYRMYPGYTCKHIGRVSDRLYDTWDARWGVRAADQTDSDAPLTYYVSMNDGDVRTLDRDTLNWLLGAISVGDALYIARAE